MNRREFLKLGVLSAEGAALAACSGGKKPEEIDSFLNATITALETLAGRLERTQTAAIEQIPQPTAKTRPTQKEAPASISNPDQTLLNKVREKEGGEKLSLDDVLITYVVKIPRPLTSDAVYAVFGVQTTDGVKGAGVIENFNCELKELQEEGLLGEPVGSETSPAISGLWEVNKRFNQINTEVYVEHSLGTIPVLTSESHRLENDDPLTTCYKDSIFSGAGELPKKAARETAKLIKDVIEGFKEGYFDTEE